MLNLSLFRDRDIGGVADSELLGEDVEVLGKALASYLIRYSGRIICVGRDGRPSSPRLFASLLKGLQSAGAHVLDVDVVPTPVLYYSAIHFAADAGIMITGGNENADYNGFKVVCGTNLLFGQALADIYKVVQLADFEIGEGTVRRTDAAGPYLEELASQFQYPRSVKLALDGEPGAVRLMLQQLLKRLKVSLVKKSDAAVTISVSPDADQLAVLDEKGRPVAPAELLLLFGREILTRKPESVLLCDEQFPEGVYKQLAALGGKPVAVNASEPSIQARIRNEHAELSVQANGRVVFADRYYGFEDALYAACRLLEVVAMLQRPLSVETAGLAVSLTPAS